MQASPAGQAITHLGESDSPSHSVQVSLLILKILPFSVIDWVGQTGTQSPQDVHSAWTIFIAMMISFLS
jgi:hypothetical protein